MEVRDWRVMHHIKKTHSMDSHSASSHASCIKACINACVKARSSYSVWRHPFTKVHMPSLMSGTYRELSSISVFLIHSVISSLFLPSFFVPSWAPFLRSLFLLGCIFVDSSFVLKSASVRCSLVFHLYGSIYHRLWSEAWHSADKTL